MTTGKFVALPVEYGDCFFYRCGDDAVLVDGGAGRLTAGSLLSVHLPRERELRVVVCTHNDWDHASGILDLLTHWDGTVREVWLPGQWYERLEDLLFSPYEFVEELAADVTELDLSDDPEGRLGLEHLLDLDGFERLARPDDNEVPDGRRRRRDFEEAGWDYSPDSEGGIPPGEDVAISPGGWLIHTKIIAGPYAGRKLKLFAEAVEAAKNIRNIARAAYGRGARVRWFDFDAFQVVGTPSGGEPGLLEPLNSCEVLPRRVRVGALYYLALSASNRRSLAFLSQEDVSRRKPGVLFSAESDFGFPLPAPSPVLPMIATAPHHGSESNHMVYDSVSSWHVRPHKIIWVRSNGQPNCRPGDTFMRRQTRLCTVCRPVRLPYQPVKLTTTHTGMGWRRARGLRRCTCF